MKVFFKHIVIFFFGLIIFMALINSTNTESESQVKTSDYISNFEEAVDNGKIVQDGVIEKDDEIIVDQNAIGESAGKIGNSLIGALASFLELIGESIYHFFA